LVFFEALGPDLSWSQVFNSFFYTKRARAGLRARLCCVITHKLETLLMLMDAMGLGLVCFCATTFLLINTKGFRWYAQYSKVIDITSTIFFIWALKGIGSTAGVMGGVAGGLFMSAFSAGLRYYWNAGVATGRLTPLREKKTSSFIKDPKAAYAKQYAVNTVARMLGPVK